MKPGCKVNATRLRTSQLYDTQRSGKEQGVTSLVVGYDGSRNVHCMTVNHQIKVRNCGAAFADDN